MHVTLEITGGIVILDDYDLPTVSKYSWYVDNNGYARANIRKKGKITALQMHKLLCNNFEIVDHINRNRLDNRRCNLRNVNATQSLMNTSKHKDGSSSYKGVCWDKSRGKWKAAIQLYGLKFELGRFDSEHEAAVAYNKEALRLHGKFAVLNVVPSKLERK